MYMICGEAVVREDQISDLNKLFIKTPPSTILI